MLDCVPQTDHVERCAAEVGLEQISAAGVHSIVIARVSDGVLAMMTPLTLPEPLARANPGTRHTHSRSRTGADARATDIAATFAGGWRNCAE
jgi:hypothetical protein